MSTEAKVNNAGTIENPALMEHGQQDTLRTPQALWELKDISTLTSLISRDLTSARSQSNAAHMHPTKHCGCLLDTRAGVGLTDSSSLATAYQKKQCHPSLWFAQTLLANT